MILTNSAPKSYYEEYLRKRDTNRLLNTPSTLLTDRNSYVNFLEIQLERVTAACINLQSYDERFEDMQNLIVSLEQRCSTSTKLISLAQQCTEEVRAESLQKLDAYYKEFKEFKSDYTKVIDSYQRRLSDTQKLVDSISSYELKLKTIENRLETIEQEQRTMQYQTKEDTLTIHNKFNSVELSQTELSSSIESIRGTISRLTFDLEESVARTNTYVRTIEDRMNNNIESTKEVLKDDVFSLDAKVTNQYQDCKSMIQNINLETITSIKKHYNSMNNDIDEFRKKWEEDIEKLTNKTNQHIHNQIDSVQNYINQDIECMKYKQDEQANSILDLENDIYSSLKTIQSNICDLSQEQFDNSSKFEYITKSIEERIDIINESNHQLTNSMMSQSRSYNDLMLQSKANSLSINQLMDMSMSLSSPISVMKHPMSCNNEVYMNYNNDQFSTDDNNTYKKFNSNNPSLSSNIPPYHNEGILPTIPVSTGTRDSKVRRSLDHLPPPAQTSNNQARTSYDDADVAGDVRSNNIIYNNNNLQPPRRSSFEPSTNSTNVYNNQQNENNIVETNNNNKVDNSQTLNEADDTSIDTVQVIEKFVDIYNKDQNNINKRLNELVTQQFSSNNQPSTQAIENNNNTDNNTKSNNNYDKLAENSKNPGEVLENFFQNYKNDRINIIKRLDQLSTAPRHTCMTAEQTTIDKNIKKELATVVDDDDNVLLEPNKIKKIKKPSTTKLLSKVMDSFVSNYKKDHPIIIKKDKIQNKLQQQDADDEVVVDESTLIKERKKGMNIQARDEFTRYLYMNAHNHNNQYPPTHQLPTYMGVGPGLNILEPSSVNKPVWKKPNTSSPTSIRRKQSNYDPLAMSMSPLPPSLFRNYSINQQQQQQCESHTYRSNRNNINQSSMNNHHKNSINHNDDDDVNNSVVSSKSTKSTTTNGTISK